MFLLLLDFSSSIHIFLKTLATGTFASALEPSRSSESNKLLSELLSVLTTQILENHGAGWNSSHSLCTENVLFMMMMIIVIMII